MQHLDRGIFVNRGFLNGLYCPIYGCGVVIVVAALTPLKDNLLILFAGSFLLTSILEYITGFILEKYFTINGGTIAISRLIFTDIYV